MIQDEFTNLNVSRQRKYQLRHQRDQSCIICGNLELATATHCERHARAQSVRNARNRNATIRKYSSRWGNPGEQFDELIKTSKVDN